MFAKENRNNLFSSDNNWTLYSESPCSRFPIYEYKNQDTFTVLIVRKISSCLKVKVITTNPDLLKTVVDKDYIQKANSELKDQYTKLKTNNKIEAIVIELTRSEKDKKDIQDFLEEVNQCEPFPKNIKSAIADFFEIRFFENNKWCDRPPLSL